jgi:Na+/proline symporter
MSLASEVARKVAPTTRKVEPKRILAIGWGGAVLFALAVGVSLLLRRLGLEPATATVLLSGLVIATIIAAAWFGRTLTSSIFFTIERETPPPLIGLSAFTDWCSGAVLAALLALTLTGKTTLAAAIAAGLVIQAAVFAPLMQRPGIVTVPGLFTWRTGARRTGLAALVTVCSALAMFAVAEAFVAIAMAQALTGLDRATLAFAIVALAALPTFSGGWLALLITNLIFTLTVLFTLLTPAIAMAFLPESALAADPLLEEMYVAVLPIARTFSFDAENVWSKLVTFVVLTTGLAAMPVGLSRLALNVNSTAAAQSVGWASLAVFLALASLPVAAFAFSMEGSSAARSIEAQPLVGVLPIFALLLAAFNALAATLYIFSTSIIRALRRTQRRDPSERSMASIRMLTIAMGLFLVSYLRGAEQAPIDLAGPYWIAGISLAASGLFVPLVAAGWISRVPWFAHASALLVGPLVVGLAIFGVVDGPLLQTAFFGQILSAACILTGKFAPAILGRKPIDSRLSILRRPQGS